MIPANRRWDEPRAQRSDEGPNVLKNLTLLGASLLICLMGVEIALQLLDV